MILFEAFKALDALNEDTFSVSDDGIAKLDEFQNDDELTDDIDVIDTEAETEDDLQDSYVGKVILDCGVCHSKIYKDKEEVELNEDQTLANVGEECPFCSTSDGFKIIGQVEDYSAENDEPETTDDEQPAEDDDDAVEESLSVSPIKDDIRDDKTESPTNTLAEGIFGPSKKKKAQMEREREEREYQERQNQRKKDSQAWQDWCNQANANAAANKQRQDAERRARAEMRRADRERISKYSTGGGNTGHGGVHYSGGDYWESLKEAAAGTLERPMSAMGGTLSNIMTAHKDELSSIFDRESAMSFLDSIEPEVKNKGYLNTVRTKLERVPNNRISQFLYNIILKGDGMGTKMESIKESKSINEVAEVNKEDMIKAINLICNGRHSYREKLDSYLQYRRAEAIENLSDRHLRDFYNEVRDELKQEENPNFRLAQAFHLDESKSIKEEIGDNYSNNVEYCPSCGEYLDGSDISYESDNWVRYTCYHCGNSFDRTKYYNESKSINEDKSLEGTIKLTDDFYYDNVQNIKDADWDEVIELFEENGWVSGNNMIIPEGTRLRKVDHNLYYNFYEIVGSSNSEKIPILIEQENDIPHVAFENEDQPKPRNKKNKLKCPDCGTVSTRQECEREDEDDGPYLACPVCDTILYESKSIKEGMNWTNGEEEYEIDSTLASAPINSIIFIKKSYGGKNRTLKFEKVSTDKWDSLNKFNDRTGSYESDKSLKDKYIDGATWKLEKAVNESKSIQESVNNVNVKTDDSIVNVSSDENGKVTVTTEPVTATDTASEVGDVLAPVDAETQDTIMNGTSEEDSIPAEGEEVDAEVDEFVEESFNHLCGNYLREVYDNVESFETSEVKENDKGLVVEGLIKFDSGNIKKTSFILEAKDCTRSGHCRFVGSNKHLSESADPYLITGKISGGKLICESLSYNYTVDSEKYTGIVRRG